MMPMHTIATRRKPLCYLHRSISSHGNSCVIFQLYKAMVLRNILFRQRNVDIALPSNNSPPTSTANIVDETADEDLLKAAIPLRNSKIPEESDTLPIFEAFAYFFSKDSGVWTKRTPVQYAYLAIYYLSLYCAIILPLIAIVPAYWRLRLDLHHPKHSHDILHQPSLNFRPQPVDLQIGNKSWGTFVHFNRYDRDHFQHLVGSIDAAVKKYEAHRDSHGVKEKDDVMWTKKCTFEDPVDDEYACIINSQQFGTYCYRSMEYGYPDGQPCFLIRVNKIFHWHPKPYKTLAALKKAGFPLNWEEKDFDDRYVPISCTGESAIDSELLGPVVYIYPYEPGKNGIPTYFFPFSHQINFKPPGVMVHFPNVTSGVAIRIRCLLWASNVHHDVSVGGQHPDGGVHFELMVDNGFVQRKMPPLKWRHAWVPNNL